MGIIGKNLEVDKVLKLLSYSDLLPSNFQVEIKPHDINGLWEMYHFVGVI